MKKLAAVWGAVAASVLLAPSSFALGPFEGEEEPTVVYDVQSGFRNDSYDNMTSPSSGTYRFVLRFRKNDWWDGDRSTTNSDRQRAEVKGLGAHQKNSQTFDYSSSWKTSRGGSGSFWHVFQLKATNGDNGAPLVVNSIGSGTTANVRYWSGTMGNFAVARSYGFSTNTFITTTMKIKVSTGNDGALTASVNGGSFSGKTGISMYRPGATDYRPKWGSYRGVNANSPYGDDTVEHRSVSATRRQ
jgi:hypothetical protein